MRLFNVVILATYAAAATFAPSALASVMAPLSVDSFIAQKLSAIDAMIAQNRPADAIQKAAREFNIDLAPCRAVFAAPITEKTADQAPIAARTKLDQTVTLNTNDIAFKNARFLVSILAHESAVCRQNQKMYTLAVSVDPRLAPLREKVTWLRTLADLDDLATLAKKESRKKAALKGSASARYKQMASRFGLKLTPDALTKITGHVAEDLQAYDRGIGALNGLDSALLGLTVPGVIAFPKPAEAASPEFAFHYRSLLMATNALLRAQLLRGFSGDKICEVDGLVPSDMALQSKRNCTEALRLLKTYLAVVES